MNVIETRVVLQKKVRRSKKKIKWYLYSEIKSACCRLCDASRCTVITTRKC